MKICVCKFRYLAIIKIAQKTDFKGYFDCIMLSRLREIENGRARRIEESEEKVW